MLLFLFLASLFQLLALAFLVPFVNINALSLQFLTIGIEVRHLRLTLVRNVNQSFLLAKRGLLNI